MLLCGISLLDLRRFLTVGEASHDALFVSVCCCTVYSLRQLSRYTSPRMCPCKNTTAHYSTNELAMYAKCIAYVCMYYIFNSALCLFLTRRHRLAIAASNFQVLCNFWGRIRVLLNPSHLTAHHLPNIASSIHSKKALPTPPPPPTCPSCTRTCPPRRLLPLP